jgi:hypothetical protein
MTEIGYNILWISLVLGFVVSAALSLNNEDSFGEWFRTFLSFSFGFGILILIGFGVVSHFKAKNEPTYEAAYHRSDLKALKDNRDLHGAAGMVFFVGSGYIDTDLYYYFHHRSETGNWVFKKVWAEKSYPRIEIEECDCSPEYVRYATFYKNKDKWYTDGYSIDKTRDVLRVPKGTILSNFNVDLE